MHGNDLRGQTLYNLRKLIESTFDLASTAPWPPDGISDKEIEEIYDQECEFFEFVIEEAAEKILERGIHKRKFKKTIKDIVKRLCAAKHL